ncbi:hypothetical protein H6P81_014158 [Aristolochia fimbriata]|uniref:Uncharacterized protein n=1 Tax=Aristolochia fimbriata TaxID=158543 RepID=A0AAV7EIV1_ARIFI|nr:hypothetical protein H6P81_014158 [Aristolochia fimbriata]
MAAPICSTQNHINGLQAPRFLVIGSGLKPFQITKSIAFGNPSVIRTGDGHSSPRPARSLVVKNRQSNVTGGSSNEPAFINPTTPVATYTRLFKENTFLDPYLPVAPIDKRVYLSQVPQIRKVALQLMKSGKMDEAERMLRVWCDFSEDKYPLQTLLVEALIYQGKYEEANKLCAVSEVGPSDARPLLKAVAYAMLSEDLLKEAARIEELSQAYEVEAQKWWETFSKHLTVDEDASSALGEHLSLDPDLSAAKLREYSLALNQRIKAYTGAKKEEKEARGNKVPITKQYPNA